MIYEKLTFFLFLGSWRQIRNLMGLFIEVNFTDVFHGKNIPEFKQVPLFHFNGDIMDESLLV